MLIDTRRERVAQLRQERNVGAQNISLLTELPKPFRSRLSINISFLRNCFSRVAVHLLGTGIQIV